MITWHYPVDMQGPIHWGTFAECDDPKCNTHIIRGEE